MRRKFGWALYIGVCLLLGIVFQSVIAQETPFADSPTSTVVPQLFDDGPAAVVLGPDVADPGVLITLDASSSVGTGFSWTIDPDIEASPRYAVDSSGKFLYLATPTYAARFVIVLAVAGDGEVHQVKHILTVGDVPEPGPGPNPNPDPNPLVGFAKQVYDWKIELVPADKMALCETLAKSHEAIASQIAAGALKTPEEILKATADSNKDAAGVANRDDLLPFFVKLSAHLNAEQAKGGMKDLEKIRVMWLEIAQGLRRK